MLQKRVVWGQSSRKIHEIFSVLDRRMEMGLEMLVLHRAEERVWFDVYWERAGTVSKRT